MNKIIDKNILLTAVAQSKEKLVRLLLEGGTDVDYRGYDGKTALMIACCFLQQSDAVVQIVKLLLQHGADPNIRDMHGRTAIIHAFRYEVCPEVVQLLLDANANPSIPDFRGRNSFCYLNEKSVKLYDSCLSELISPTCVSRNIGNMNSVNIPIVTLQAATPRKTSLDSQKQYFHFDDKTELKKWRRKYEQSNIKNPYNTHEEPRCHIHQTTCRKHTKLDNKLALTPKKKNRDIDNFPLIRSVSNTSLTQRCNSPVQAVIYRRQSDGRFNDLKTARNLNLLSEENIFHGKRKQKEQYKSKVDNDAHGQSLEEINTLWGDSEKKEVVFKLANITQKLPPINN